MRNTSLRDAAAIPVPECGQRLPRKSAILAGTTYSYISNQQFRSNPLASKFGRLDAR